MGEEYTKRREAVNYYFAKLEDILNG